MNERRYGGTLPHLAIVNAQHDIGCLGCESCGQCGHGRCRHGHGADVPECFACGDDSWEHDFVEAARLGVMNDDER